MRKHSMLVLVVISIVLLTACGQKPGVHSFASGNGGLGGGDGTTAAGGSGTDGTITGPGGTATGPGGTGTGPGGTVTGPGGTGAAGSTDSGCGTCVTATTITIGIHAPVTGAAPIKAEAFNYGKDLYTNWQKHLGKSIYGRQIKFVFADDHYNPQTAATVCEQMATQQHAFMLIGAAGTDQISQCAFYANQHGIPYLSAGVTKSGTNYPTYFGITMTYSDQMPLLAQYVKKLGSGEDRYGPNGIATDGAIKVAMVAPDTPNFADARTAMIAAFTKLGAPYQIRVYPVQKDENPTDAAGVIAQIKQWGADLISPITAPVFTIALSNASGSQQYFPRYVGVGVTNAINQAISNECTSNQFGGPGTGHPAAMFFSPFSGWAQRNKFDPDYDKAVALAGSGAQNINQKGNGGDLMWSLWGVSKGLYKMLLAAGPNLSRAGLINMLSTYSTRGASHDFPNVTYTPTDRWGAYEVHALTADCANKEWVEDPNNFGLHSRF